jgi:hypothetical protein
MESIMVLYEAMDYQMDTPALMPLDSVEAAPKMEENAVPPFFAFGDDDEDAEDDIDEEDDFEDMEEEEFEDDDFEDDDFEDDDDEDDDFEDDDEDEDYDYDEDEGYDDFDE